MMPDECTEGILRVVCEKTGAAMVQA
jgi:hypothetical protein